MGWFKKKSDPISERARDLNNQIAELEAQIRDLSSQPEAEAEVADNGLSSEHESLPDVDRSMPVPPPPPAPSSKPKWSQAKLRSTAFPLGTHVPAAAAPHPAVPNPVFEEVNPFRNSADPVSPSQELDVRKSDWAAGWRRFKNHFRSPATSNPKLVNYLAAGSIQGLRPLRYEKRVARNRFILLLVVLVLVLWGIIALVLRH